MVQFTLNPNRAQEIDIGSVSHAGARVLLEEIDDNNDGVVSLQEQGAWLQQSLLDSFTLGRAVYQQEKMTQQASDLLASLYQRAGIFGNVENFSPNIITVQVDEADKKNFLASFEKLAQTKDGWKKANRIFSSLSPEGQIEILNAIKAPALAAKLVLTQNKESLLEKDSWQRTIPGGGEEKRVAIESMLHCFYDEDTLQKILPSDLDLHQRILDALKKWQPGTNDKAILKILNDEKKFPNMSAEIVFIPGTNLKTIKVYLPAQNQAQSMPYENDNIEPEESLVFRGGGRWDQKYVSPSGIEYYGTFGRTKLGDGSIVINNPEITGDHLSVEFKPDDEGTIKLDLTTDELYWYDLAADPNDSDNFIEVRRADTSRDEMVRSVFTLFDNITDPQERDLLSSYLEGGLNRAIRKKTTQGE